MGCMRAGITPEAVRGIQCGERAKDAAHLLQKMNLRAPTLDLKIIKMETHFRTTSTRPEIGRPKCVGNCPFADILDIYGALYTSTSQS